MSLAWADRSAAWCSGNLTAQSERTVVNQKPKFSTSGSLLLENFLWPNSTLSKCLKNILFYWKTWTVDTKHFHRAAHGLQIVSSAHGYGYLPCNPDEILDHVWLQVGFCRFVIRFWHHWFRLQKEDGTGQNVVLALKTKRLSTGNDRYSGKNGQGFLFHYNGRFH